MTGESKEAKFAESFSFKLTLCNCSIGRTRVSLRCIEQGTHVVVFGHYRQDYMVAGAEKTGQKNM
tara:strand:+ start:519 stop:713 length:195 start_codon:yes stop_codon:yes gene_type:complete